MKDYLTFLYSFMSINKQYYLSLSENAKMATFNETELLKTLDRLRSAIESLSRVTETTETRRRQRVESGGGEFRPKDVKRTFFDLYKNVGKASKSFKDTAEAMTDLHEAATLSSEEHDKLTASILKSTHVVNLYNDQTHKSIRSMRLFDEENRKTAANLDDIFNMLNKSINGSEEQYSKLMQHIKDANGDYSKMAPDALAYMMAVNDAKDSLKGFEKGLDSSLEEIQKAATNAEKNQKAIQENTRRQYAAAQAASSVQQRFGIFGDALTGVASKSAIVGFAIVELGKAAKLAWEQFITIGKTGLSDQYLDLYKSSFRLGVGLDKMQQFTKDNILAMRMTNKGLDEFVDSVNSHQNALTGFTYSTEESAAGLMAMRSDLFDMGAAFDSAQTLDKAMTAQTALFGKLHAATGTSMEEFIRLNKELVTSQSVQMSLLGLDKKARLQKILELQMARENMVEMGLTAQEAQEAVKRIQDIGKEKVVDRFEQAAQLRRAMSMEGIAGGVEAQRILLSGSFRNNMKDAETLRAAIQATRASLDKRKMFGGIAEENVADTLNQTLTPLFNQFDDISRKAELRKQAANDGRIDADQLVNKTNIEDTWQEMLINLIGKWNSVFTTPMGNIIKTIGLIVAGWAGKGAWNMAKNWYVNRGISKTGEAIAEKSGSKVLNFLGRFGETFKSLMSRVPWEGFGRVVGKWLGPVTIGLAGIFNMFKMGEIFGKEANDATFSQTLTTYFMGFPKMIGKIIDSIFGTDMESVFDTSTIVISRFFTDLYDGVVNFFQYSWDLVTGHGTDLLDKLSLVMKRVIHSFGNIMSGISDMIQEAPNTIFSMYDRYFGDNEAKERSKKYDEFRAKANAQRDAQRASDNKAFEESIKADIEKINQKRAESKAAFKTQQANAKAEKDKKRIAEDEAFVQTLVNRNKKKAADAAKKDAEEAIKKNKAANSALEQLMSNPKAYLGLTKWSELSENLASTVINGGTSGISNAPTINNTVAPSAAQAAATSSTATSTPATTEKTTETTLADVAALLRKLIDIEQRNLVSQQDQFDYMKSLKGTGLVGQAAANVLEAFGNPFPSKFDMSQRA
ncbi:MAG: hypothetical protein QXN55_01250 [Candidatus Nitrosotenuis sp.]